ncbi:MAG: BolA family transcriptional regulator [Candidatus Marinimicrobia bacterium]|nr:BolA family transcriptional regulator [Candidatus Neomarinimicrobiota bacterium]
MYLFEEIEKRLKRSMNINHLEILDDTGKHIHHKTYERGAHLSAVIVSSNFNDINLLERHRMVYNALNGMIKNEIHALSMKTYTLDEWQYLKGFQNDKTE